MTTLERIARAILAAVVDPSLSMVYAESSPKDLTNVTIDGQVDLMLMARAAIEAMEPNAAMCEAAKGETLVSAAEMKAIWNAMRRAALEKQQ